MTVTTTHTCDFCKKEYDPKVPQVHPYSKGVSDWMRRLCQTASDDLLLKTHPDFKAYFECGETPDVCKSCGAKIIIGLNKIAEESFEKMVELFYTEMFHEALLEERKEKTDK